MCRERELCGCERMCFHLDGMCLGGQVVLERICAQRGRESAKRANARNTEGIIVTEMEQCKRVDERTVPKEEEDEYRTKTRRNETEQER